MRSAGKRFVPHLIFIACIALIATAPAHAAAVILKVNTTADHDDGFCSADDCTLREAIHAANSDGQDDLIAFDFQKPGPFVIKITSLLPPLKEARTTIDGTTQPGYGSEPVVILTGDVSVPVPVGLEIQADRCVVRGLALAGFIDDGSGNTGAITISGGSDSLVEKNYIGIAPVPVTARNSLGVRIASDGQVVRKNVISNNILGLRVDEGVTRQTIQANRIGTDPSGTTSVPNIGGIMVMDNTSEVLIGGPGEGNLISGNEGEGIMASGHGHWIKGNLIGTDITGGTALRNFAGIDIAGPADGFQIGGPGPGEGNVISGNWDFGIYIGGGRHTIQGNKIGTDLTGTRAVGNSDGLILSSYSIPNGPIYESHDVLVGGVMSSGAENIISGNRDQGISILTSHHIIQGNFIGTDAAGMSAIPNGWEGISISGNGHDNLIGGAGAGRGNLISGNNNGVVLYSDNNQVAGNLIGTKRTGNAALGNGIGVQIFGSGNFVGTGTPDAGNVISGNIVGVAVEQGNGNRVLGNRIGTSADGLTVIPNSVGITIGMDYDLDPIDTIVGAGAGNWIEWNLQCGIVISERVHFAQISGNRIDNNGRLAGGMCGGQGILIAGTSLEVAGITIHKNTIFQNRGLGIEIVGSLANGSIDPPVLTGGSMTKVEGTACPGCRVEVFLADVDPTGFGEGKTFLHQGVAGADGSFSIPLAGVGNCGVATATATDANENTSEFSKNLRISPCAWVPPIFVLIEIPFLTIIVGVAAFFFGRRRGRWKIPLTAMGGLLGAGVGVLVLVLPFVRVNSPRNPAGANAEYAPLPPCSQYLDLSHTGPPDGEIFDVGTDVRIEVSPESSVSGEQTRWKLMVNGPSGISAAKEFTGDLSIRLSELGLDAPSSGSYIWKVAAEQMDPAAKKWMPICRDLGGRVFHLNWRRSVGTPTPTATAPRKPETGITPEPEPTLPTATLLQNAYCLRGPGTAYDSLAVLLQGVRVEIDGRNAEGTWWYVRVPNSPTRCWVGSRMVITSGDVINLPVIEAPPLGCWVYQQGSVTHKSDQTVCVVPCPAGAKPGGVCEP